MQGARLPQYPISIVPKCFRSFLLYLYRSGKRFRREVVERLMRNCLEHPRNNPDALRKNTCMFEKVQERGKRQRRCEEAI
jgi:hypothetical protein